MNNEQGISKCWLGVLWCEEGVCFAFGYFYAFVFADVLKCENVIFKQACTPVTIESDTSVTREDVLASTVMVDTVTSGKLLVQRKIERIAITATAGRCVE